MHAAFRSGAVMGFLLAGLGLLNLFIAIVVFLKVSSTNSSCFLWSRA